MSTSSETIVRDWTGFDHVDAIIRFETGECTDEEGVTLFQYLLDNNMINQLQGEYGRTAEKLLSVGLIAPLGEEPTATIEDIYGLA